MRARTGQPKSRASHGCEQDQLPDEVAIAKKVLVCPTGHLEHQEDGLVDKTIMAAGMLRAFVVLHTPFASTLSQ